MSGRSQAPSLWLLLGTAVLCGFAAPATALWFKIANGFCMPGVGLGLSLGVPPGPTCPDGIAYFLPIVMSAFACVAAIAIVASLCVLARVLPHAILAVPFVAAAPAVLVVILLRSAVDVEPPLPGVHVTDLWLWFGLPVGIAAAASAALGVAAIVLRRQGQPRARLLLGASVGVAAVGVLVSLFGALAPLGCVMLCTTFAYRLVARDGSSDFASTSTGR